MSICFKLKSNRGEQRVICRMNHKKHLDPALLRQGRMDIRIYTFTFSILLCERFQDICKKKKKNSTLKGESNFIYVIQLSIIQQSNSSILKERERMKDREVDV